MKKYEFTGETKEWLGRTLHRIRAVIDFKLAGGFEIKAGTLGGWIEKEENLSQEGSAWVCDSAMVCDSARVFGSARVCDSAEVFGSARVFGSAEVCDSAMVYDSAMVCDSAMVYGSAMVFGSAEVCDSAMVCDTTDILWIAPIGSRNACTTFFKCEDGKCRVRCGCFYGDLDEFAAKVKETHGDNQHAKEYMAAIELAKVRFGGNE
ncbi:MAG: polymer-forming cytoskeletal protein [Firmicutes bacterium]|nr:polymer-forming cytoskeletal protein [Bacillota bacterium]